MRTSGANDPQQLAVASEGAPSLLREPGRREDRSFIAPVPASVFTRRAAVNSGDGGAFLPMAIDRADGNMALRESEQP
jgi:hypothetical protein